jgi:polysaccharide biosynthesis protein PslE
MNAQPLNLVDLWRTLQRRLFLLLLVFGVIVGAGMMMTLLTPPTYQSTMKILVTRNRLDPQVSASDKTGDSSRGELTEEDFNSEIEILQSRAVLEATVKQLNLEQPNPVSGVEEESPSLRGRLGNWYRKLHRQEPATEVEKAVTELAGRLDVVSVKKSHILQVTYQDNSPERAAHLLQLLYRQYAEHHLQLNQNEEAAQVFRTQSDDFNRKLREATDTLKQFDAANGLTGSTTQRDLLLQQSYQIQAQLNDARTSLHETEERIATLKAQLATTPERIESEILTKYAPSRDRMKEEILHLEMESAQLRQKYQSNHRLVKETDERLAQARKLLTREEQASPQERKTIVNEVYHRLTNDLLAAQGNLAALKQREQSLAILAQQYQAKTTRFDTKSLERAELERARAVAEEAYLLYHKKAQEAEISNVMNQAKIANINLAQPASVNHKPVSPKLLINLVVLLVVGLLAGLATVLFIERENLVRPQRVMTPIPASEGLVLAITRLQQRDEQMLTERRRGFSGAGADPPARYMRKLPGSQTSLQLQRLPDRLG